MFQVWKITIEKDNDAPFTVHDTSLDRVINTINDPLQSTNSNVVFTIVKINADEVEM